MWQKDRTSLQDKVAKGKMSEIQQEKAQDTERAYALKLANLGQLCALSLVGDSLEKGELIEPEERTTTRPSDEARSQDLPAKPTSSSQPAQDQATVRLLLQWHRQ